MAETESQDDVFGLHEPDVNQNKDCSSKSTGTTASSASPSEDQANQEDPNLTEPRPHLVRLFSRDAPGRVDNTFKDRPSESDELHTIPEAGAGLENAEQDTD
ncbi:myelin basic protein-like isoform X2 [Pygocentrus nattereri]|nr:myelin basic protein-like isoform X2 [Pygocentrus nattereri]